MDKVGQSTPIVGQPQPQPTPPASPVESSPWLKILIIGGVVLVLFLAGAVVYLAQFKTTPPKEIACTQEAKQCPDGSYVSRTGPNCAFAPCSGGKDATPTPDPTANWKIYKNEKYGFEVKYPPSLNVHEYGAPPQDSESEFWLILNKQPTLAKGKEITIYYPWKDLSYIDKGLYITVTPEEWVQIDKPDYTCRECAASFKNQQTTFAGIKATKSVAEFPDDSLVNDGLQPYTYLIFNYQEKGWSIAYDHSDFKGSYDPLYDKILSTFKFLD